VWLCMNGSETTGERDLYHGTDVCMVQPIASFNCRSPLVHQPPDFEDAARIPGQLYVIRRDIKGRQPFYAIEKKHRNFG